MPRSKKSVDLLPPPAKVPRGEPKWRCASGCPDATFAHETGPNGYEAHARDVHGGAARFECILRHKGAPR